MPNFDLNDDSVVVIIGSGAGGGTMASELTKRGINVVCLEAGGRLQQSDIVNDTIEMFGKMSWMDYRVGEGYAPDGMPVWSCKLVGGTTAHWTACCPRFRGFEFKGKSTYGEMENTSLVDWPIDLETLTPYYEKAEDMLGVTGTNGIERLPPSNNYKVMEAGAKNIGYSDMDTYNMAINSKPRDGRASCLQLGFCASGCAMNAKWSTLFNHIPEAEATDNFDLRPNSMAIEITTNSEGRAAGVRYIDADGNIQEQKARVVCVAANVVETTRLLLNSSKDQFPNGLANSSDMVGRNYMRHVMVQIFALMPDEVNMFKGTQCAGVIRDEVRHDPSRGFSAGFQFHTVGLDPEQIAKTLVDNGWGRDYAETMLNYRNLAGLIITGEDPPQLDNRITLHPTQKDQFGLPVPVVTYNLHPNSRALLDYSEKKSKELYESLGATEVFNIESFGATHNMGTARIGDDPAISVCNEWGQTHDVDNLFISDGSLFPTSGCANPTLTIISLMLRQADYLEEQLKSNSI